MSVSSPAARLPDIPTPWSWSHSLAMLDAVLSREGETRYFSLDARWDAAEQMASVRNGSRDEYSFTFTGHGVYGRGFDNESQLSPFARRRRLVVVRRAARSPDGAGRRRRRLLALRPTSAVR